MRILGIDPGYAIVGFGALDYTRNTFTTLQYGAITTKAHTTFEDRLSEIYDDMTQLLAAVKPDAMAIETLFYTTNQKTVIAVAEARGVLLLCARQAGVPVFEYTPLQVKQSVSGYGKATKKQVQEAARRAQTGRHGRRAGYGHLPCVQLPFQTVWRGADKAPANGIFLI